MPDHGQQRQLAPVAPLALRVGSRQAVSNLTFGMVWLAAVVVVLDVWFCLANGLGSVPLGEVFDATSEIGLGSWLSVTQAALLALTLGGVAALHRAAGAPRARRWGWAVLACFFAYLAVDDGVRLHERVGAAFGATAAADTGLGALFPSYNWQLLFGPALAGFGGFTALFLWREVPGARLRTAGAFALLATAIGLDFVDGLDPEHPLNAYAWLARDGRLDATALVLFDREGLDAVVHVSRAVEESLEMVAMTLLWTAVLGHALAASPGLRLHWDAPAPAALAPGAPARQPAGAGRTLRARRARQRPAWTTTTPRSTPPSSSPTTTAPTRPT